MNLMPVKKSGLAAKLGKAGAKAVKDHAGDETSYGQVDLPGGIRNGQAKLVECKFDTYKSGNNQGEYYWLAAGTVVSPNKAPNGQKVKGLRTQIMVPVCETPNSSLEDNLARAMNEMRKLGIDTDGCDVGDLESLAEALKEAAPMFSFSTQDRYDRNDIDKKTKKPKEGAKPNGAWENWNGAVEDDNDTEEEDDIEEDEEEDVEEEDVEEEEDELEDDEEEEDSDEDEEDESGKEAELRELARLAEKGKTVQKKKLAKIAEEAGMSEEDIDNADSWQDVAEETIRLLSEDSDDDDEEEDDEEEEEESLIPEKGGEYSYKPPKKRKPVVLTVTAVFKKSEKVNGKDESGATHKGVTWDKLSEIED